MVTRAMRGLTLWAVMALLFGTISSAQAQEPLHVGILAPLSGPFAPLGSAVRDGVEQALADDGRLVRITAIDDACTEEQGRDAANQLVGAGVDFVVGGVCWRPAVAALGVLAFNNIPLFASGVRYGPLTDDAMPGSVFRLSGRDDLQADFIAAALLQGELDGAIERSFQRANRVLLFTDGSYGRTLAESLTAHLNEAGLTFALNETFDPEDGLDRAAARALAEDPDVILVFAGQADTALMVSALRDRGLNGPIITGDSALTAEFPLLAGDASEGVVFARPALGAASSSGGTLGIQLSTHAATQVALARADGQTDEPYQTDLGLISFAPNGDANLPSFELWTWRQGIIWPFGEVPSDLDEAIVQ